MSSPFSTGQLHPAPEPGRWNLRLDPSWKVQSYFGGMLMAAGLRAAEGELARPDLAVRSVSATFASPVQADDAACEVEILRSGRSVASAMARLSGAEGGSAPLVGLMATFGTPNGDGEADSREAPRAPDPEACRPLAPRPGQDGQDAAPGSSVAAQVDWRCLSGWQRETLAWIRPHQVPRAPDGRLDRLWYLVAADLLGPAVVDDAPFFPFYVATVSLDVQILRDTGDEWLLQRLTGGAIDRDAWARLKLWDRSRRLVATASQRASLLKAEPDDLPYCVTALGYGSCRVDR